VAGRLKRIPTARRDHIETAQVLLICSIGDIEEIILRNQQAVQHNILADNVLSPAIERLIEMRDDLALAQRELGHVWADGQASRWSTSGNS